MLTNLGPCGKRNHRALGNLGEDLALKFLLKKGYTLIKRNYCIRGGEIDLIVKKSGILLFVEVKTRFGVSFGLAGEALNNYKKKKLLLAIQTYLSQYQVWPEWRCDLVAIDFGNYREAKIQHFENIFLT